MPQDDTEQLAQTESEGTEAARSLVAKYGVQKLARYFVRSPEDLSDVCEAILEQVGRTVEPEDAAAVLSLIECRAMAVPHSLSSFIFAFGIPKTILEGPKLNRRQWGKWTFQSPKELSVQVSYTPTTTVLMKGITTAFDLLCFHSFLKAQQPGREQAMKLAVARRAAVVQILQPSEPNHNLDLVVTLPGIHFQKEGAENQA